MRYSATAGSPRSYLATHVCTCMRKSRAIQIPLGKHDLASADHVHQGSICPHISRSCGRHVTCLPDVRTNSVLARMRALKKSAICVTNAPPPEIQGSLSSSPQPHPPSHPTPSHPSYPSTRPPTQQPMRTLRPLPSREGHENC